MKNNETMQDYATSIMADNYVRTKVAFVNIFKRKCMRLYNAEYVTTKTRYNSDSVTISFFHNNESLCEVEVNKEKFKRLK